MNAPSPATYSTLCPDALATLISQRYALPHVKCKLLVRGVGDTYLVECSRKRYILRIYRASHRSLAQIQEEVTLLLALNNAKVSVSFPIAESSGAFILAIDAAEGERHAVLFSYADGLVVKNLNNEQLNILGMEMAHFHNISAQFGHESSRWTFDLETTLFTPLKLLQHLTNEAPDTYDQLKNIAAHKLLSIYPRLTTTSFQRAIAISISCQRTFTSRKKKSLSLILISWVKDGWSMML